jgi:hypothetical protein
MDDFLKQPVLSVTERDNYSLVGAVRVSPTRVRYQNARRLPPEWQPSSVQSALERSDEVEVDGNILRFFCESSFVEAVETRADQVAPEAPGLVYWQERPEE